MSTAHMTSRKTVKKAAWADGIYSAIALMREVGLSPSDSHRWWLSGWDESAVEASNIAQVAPGWEHLYRSEYERAAVYRVKRAIRLEEWCSPTPDDYDESDYPEPHYPDDSDDCDEPACASVAEGAAD